MTTLSQIEKQARKVLRGETKKPAQHAVTDKSLVGETFDSVELGPGRVIGKPEIGVYYVVTGQGKRLVKICDMMDWRFYPEKKK